ncbi:EMC4 protein, partial [Polypterus senegalus]
MKEEMQVRMVMEIEETFSMKEEMQVQMAMEVEVWMTVKEVIKGWPEKEVETRVPERKVKQVQLMMEWKVLMLATRGRSDRQGNQGDSLYPVGYSDKPIPDASVQETDRNLVEKRCWDVALGPLKQIPMNLFIMYMAGNTISIFPIMMVCMMAWRPIQALMSMSATFKLLESSSQQWLQSLVYFVGNLLGLALAVYKCQSMGLLPTHSSDWLAFIEPPEDGSLGINGYDFTSSSSHQQDSLQAFCQHL